MPNQFKPMVSFNGSQSSVARLFFPSRASDAPIRTKNTDMLSQKAKYALRAVLMLAEYADRDDPLAICDIAQREAIPRKFLEAILVELRDHNLLKSKRGRKGGYRLAKSPQVITFGDVIRIIDGPLAPIRCASRSGFEPCDDCTNVETCSVRWVMLKARDAIAQALDGCTLAEAVQQRRGGNIVPLDFSV